MPNNHLFTIDQVTPYLYVKDNEFRGYCDDVMTEISKIAGFNYSLYLTPGNRHGDVSPLGEINGLLGEVFNNVSSHWILISNSGSSIPQ